jgi:carboxymethylenebutenolidase
MERKKASDFPQEFWSLFDQYQHGGISRRDFIEGAQKFAVGGLTATALFEMVKPNYALAAEVAPDDKRIKTPISKTWPGGWLLPALSLSRPTG